MSNKSQELYQAALEADDRFDQAIEAQFGQGATRWTVSYKAFNQETQQAYQALLLANEALHAEWEKIRSGAAAREQTGE